jgi:hypothetical protein
MKNIQRFYLIMSLIYVVVMSLVLIPVTAKAEGGVKSSVVLEACRYVANGGQDWEMAEGYCLGIIEGIEFVNTISIGSGGLGICWPEGSTKIQALKVIVKTLDEEPESLHKPFAGMAYASLMRIWPCDPNWMNGGAE